jgi:hypothetical protein
MLKDLKRYIFLTKGRVFVTDAGESGHQLSQKWELVF